MRQLLDGTHSRSLRCLMDHEALIFLHIPKTAGTTLNRIIEWQYNPLSIFTIDAHQIRATAERFKSLPEWRRRGFRVIRGHQFYGIHEFLPQGATYFTMLREPVARLLSSYHFILRDPLNPLHRKFQREQLTVEDLIRLAPNRQNLQCRFLAGIGRIQDIRMRGRAGRATSGQVCDKGMLDLAKENLRSFGVVGLCERFQESLLLMIAAFGWNVPFYENRKVANLRPSVDPDVIQAIREHSRFDIQLYDFAKELFEEKLRRNADVISKGLANLNSRQEPGLFKKVWYSTQGAGRFLLSKAASAF